MRQWPNDPTVAHLVFIDHADVPTPDQVAHAVAHARDRGARAIRTSALFPRAADVVLGQGFEPIDRLTLLSRPISRRSTPPAGRPTRPLMPWHHGDAAEVDRDAFGPLWGNDASSLRDIRRATPHHRARVVRDGRALVGFAISGAAGDAGYLQRLAVVSTHRRLGHARDLVVDALRWMSDGGLTSVLVNTGVANSAALALYDGLGFRRLPDELTIAELRIGAMDVSATGAAASKRVPDHGEPPAAMTR